MCIKMNKKKTSVAVLMLTSLILFVIPAFSQTASTELTASDTADMAFIKKMLGNQGYGELNLGDERQRRFFMKQLDLGGFSPDNYPMLFSSIYQAVSEAKKNHVSAGEDGVLMQPVSTEADPVVPVVNITALGRDPYTRELTATVQLSVPNKGNDAPPVAMTTIGLYDQDGCQIGKTNGISENFAGFDLQNTVVGVPAKPVSQLSVRGSYYYIDMNGTPHSGVMYVETALSAFEPIVRDTARPRMVPGLSNQIIRNISPADVKKNNVIKVCVVRRDSDCDYVYSSTEGKYIVKFPIEGNITFPVPLKPIEDQKTHGIVNISLTQANPTQGGGCTLPANFNFWDYATINGNVLSWKIDPGPFSNPSSNPQNPCFPSDSVVIYNLFVTVLGTDSTPYLATITSSQISPPPPNTLVIYPMSVAYGCVAEGSLIALPDGSAIPVEKLVPGQLLKGRGGNVVAVDGLSDGIESIPMVRLKTVAGQRLLLTETHPAFTPDGPVMAKALRPGQMIMTENGMAELDSVSREPGNRVWNIAISSAGELCGGEQGFFANGILVGDAAAQHRAETRERAALAEKLRNDIPVEWRVDAASARARLGAGM